MKVATYSDHHFLPFWHSPKNPNGFFDPNAISEWTCEGYGIDGKDVQKNRPATEHYIMPVLMGLFFLDLPGVMAHVSMIFDHEKRTIDSPKRIWVQITTEPKEWDDTPIVKDNKVQVEHLWGGDNKTYNPFGFLKIDADEKEIHTSEFWIKFFLSKLKEEKEEVCRLTNEARSEAELVEKRYSVIP